MTEYLDLSEDVDGEEELAPFRFALHGEKFEVSVDLKPAQRKLMSEAQRTEDVETLLSAIFGADELARLDALDLSLRQLWVVIEKYNEFLAQTGSLTLGESSASTTQRKNTGTPSKRISRTTSRR